MSIDASGGSVFDPARARDIAPSSGKVELRVGNTSYTGWKTIRVSRSIEAVCGSFEVGISERLLPKNWVSGFDDGLPIDVGNKCVLAVDGAPVITGYVDDIVREIGPSAHEASISGRDSTGDLVDCSAVYPGGWFKNQDLADIALALLKPFKIGLSVNVDHGARFRLLKIEPGESVYEILERLARMRGVLLTTDGYGNLLITRAGLGLGFVEDPVPVAIGAETTRRGDSLTRLQSSLVLGRNVLSVRVERSQRDRYSEYTVKGQIPIDENSTAQYNKQLRGVAKNDSVVRYRPLILIAEQPDDSGGFKSRAEWERNVREGRSARFSVTVQGWHHEEGLWAPNHIVRLQAKQLGIEGADLLIASVTYLFDESGSRTELSLTWPWAFDPLPMPEKGEQWFRIR